MRSVTEGINSKVNCSQTSGCHRVRFKPAIGHPVRQDAERVDDVWTDEIGVAESKGLGHGVVGGTDTQRLMVDVEGSRCLQTVD